MPIYTSLYSSLKVDCRWNTLKGTQMSPIVGTQVSPIDRNYGPCPKWEPHVLWKVPKMGTIKN
jgi:hypothetical protein